MTLKCNQELSLADGQGHDLGKVQIDRIQGDLVFGRFTPGPAYPHVESLFAEYVDAANEQLLGIVGDLDQKIGRLNLNLRSADPTALPAIRDVQIDDGTINFRIKAEPAKEKEELLKGLDAAEREANRIEAAAKDALQNARLISDTVPHLRTIYQEMPVSALPPNEWARQNQNMRSWLGIAKSILPTHMDVSIFGAVSPTTANTAISGVMLAFPLPQLESTAVSCSICPSSPPCPPIVQQATERLAAIVEKYPSLDKARTEIRRLGLDSRAGNSKPALQLLDDARLSLEMPVVEDGALGALVGLRECIITCVSELIRRRPSQEQAKNWQAKVTSLGRHCGRSGLNPAHFESLGLDAESMIDLLSRAKQNNYARPEIQRLFTKGLLFLVGLLSSIDECKLRPN